MPKVDTKTLWKGGVGFFADAGLAYGAKAHLLDAMEILQSIWKVHTDNAGDNNASDDKYASEERRNLSLLAEVRYFAGIMECWY